jgi:hypothetical protein
LYNVQKGGDALYRNCACVVVILITLHCTKNPIYVLPEMKLGGLIPNSFEQFIYSQDRSAYLAADLSWEYINRWTLGDRTV